MQGPDTDAQDQHPPKLTFGLQRTAGPYTWVTSVVLCNSWLPVNFRYALATRCNMSRRATCGKLPADMWDYQAHASTQDKPTVGGFSTVPTTKV